MKRHLPAWAALAAVVVLYIALQVYPLLRFGGGSANDFKHIYLGSILLSEGGNPYSEEELRATAGLFYAQDERFRSILPYVYLPFTGMVMKPIAMMDFAHAVIAWNIVNHLLLALALFLGARAAGLPFNAKTILIVGSIAVFNHSLFRQNDAGQLNIVLLAGYALVYTGITRGWKPWLIGLIAAFLMMFKLTPGILLFYFLLTRRWHEAAFMVAFAIAMMLLTVALYGLETHLAFLPVLSEMGYGKSTWAHLGQTFWRDPYNQSMNSFLHHLLVSWNGAAPPIPGSAPLANGLTMLFGLGILGLTALGLWRGRDRDDTTPAGFSLALLASLLVPSLMWDHYLTQALLPVLLLWGAVAGRRAPVAKTLLVVIVVLLSLGIEFSAGFVHFGLFEYALRSIFGFEGHLPIIPLPQWPVLRELLLSIKLWATVALFGLAYWTLSSKSNSGSQSSDFEPTN